MLSAAAAVVTTSAWSRRRLLELYGLAADRVHVAEPGVDAADLAGGTAAGGALLCVAAVTSDKGHDVLLDALATMTELSWQLRVRGQPGHRPGVRGGPASPLTGRRARRARPLPGTADRRRARPQLRRRGPDGAGVARRDVRHGRQRGSGPRPSGGRDRRRRGAGGPRPRRRRDPAGAAGSAGGPCGAQRRAPGLARRRRAEGAAAPGRVRAARVASRLDDHHVRRSQASWRGRSDDRRADPGQQRLACAARAR